MKFDIAKMLNPGVYPHPVSNIELIETHISWVILTGEFAYKIKKPVNFGFLDFSTLEKRYVCCQNELRLNRRLAASIYLDVVAITGTGAQPVIADSGEAFEYAVKMAQFPQSAQLDVMLTAGQLNAQHMDAIARMVAGFHQRIAIADEATDYGSSAVIYQPVEENFNQISEHIDTTPYAATLAALRHWSAECFSRLSPVFTQRKGDGFVRECHGDMHLRNLLWLQTGAESGPVAFDCIEFNDHLRWIDVQSEIAFLIMDLQARQQPSLANRFLNSYLELSGDYAGLAVLPFYLCYRAMVRAKVDALRLEQPQLSSTQRQQTRAEFEAYLQLASTYTQPKSAKLIIMRGLSASGKSTVAQQLLDAGGMIRIRSDVERKRLHAIPAEQNAGSCIDSGIYSAQASAATYHKLVELAEQVIKAGYSVIIDAAFLQAEQRLPFQQLAQRLGVAYIILEITAPVDILRQRIIARKNDVSDADLSVLEHQLAHTQPLSAAEQRHAISVNTANALDVASLLHTIVAKE